MKHTKIKIAFFILCLALIVAVVLIARSSQLGLVGKENNNVAFYTDMEASDEPIGIYQEPGFFESIFGFIPFAVSTSDDNPGDWVCTDYTGQKTFNSADRSTIKVGKYCDDNAKVELWQKRGSGWSREAIGWKVNGESPKFVGFYYDTDYKYKCYSCDETTQKNPNSKGWCFETVYSSGTTSYRCVSSYQSECSGTFYSDGDGCVEKKEEKQGYKDSDLESKGYCLVKYNGDQYTCDFREKSDCSASFYNSYLNCLNAKQDVQPPEVLGYCLQHVDSTYGAKYYRCVSTYESKCDGTFYKGSTSGSTCQATADKNNKGDDIVKKYKITCNSQGCSCYLSAYGTYDSEGACKTEADKKTAVIQKLLSDKQSTEEQKEAEKEIVENPEFDSDDEFDFGDGESDYSEEYVDEIDSYLDESCTDGELFVVDECIIGECVDGESVMYTDEEIAEICSELDPETVDKVISSVNKAQSNNSIFGFKSTESKIMYGVFVALFLIIVGIIIFARRKKKKKKK